MDIGGYWISPKGKIYRIQHDHYHAIQAYPRLFGLKAKQVKDQDLRHLQELANGLIRKGWIRARDRGFHGWTFLMANVEDQLGQVAEILSKTEAGAQEMVTLAGVDDKFFYIGDVTNVFTGEILRHPQR